MTDPESAIRLFILDFPLYQELVFNFTHTIVQTEQIRSDKSLLHSLYNAIQFCFCKNILIIYIDSSLFISPALFLPILPHPISIKITLQKQLKLLFLNSYKDFTWPAGEKWCIFPDYNQSYIHR